MTELTDDFAEVPIDGALVARLVGAQFPEWAGFPIVRAAEFGTDNAMYRIGDHLATSVTTSPARRQHTTAPPRPAP